jgi:7-keto-8-aminopelargonate synthetase-like enzyme
MPDVWRARCNAAHRELHAIFVQPLSLSAQLFNAGVFVQAVTFPTVPRGTARLRVMLSAAHTREDLAFALETFARLGRECQLIPAA